MSRRNGARRIIDLVDSGSPLGNGATTRIEFRAATKDRPHYGPDFVMVSWTDGQGRTVENRMTLPLEDEMVLASWLLADIQARLAEMEANQ